MVADDVPPALLEPVEADPDDVAYVLFTSGSTGRPKAVAQTHRNLLHVVDNQIASLDVTPADRLSLLASFSFDAAIPDLYPALLTGAAVVPVDVRTHGLAHAAAALARHGVTIYHSTPTVYRYLLDALGPDRLGRRAHGAARRRAVHLRRRARGPPDVRAGLRVRQRLRRHRGHLRRAVPAAGRPRWTRRRPGRCRSAPRCPATSWCSASDGEITVRGRHLVDGYANGGGAAFCTGADGVRELPHR